jgi:hypothetical protein
MIETGARAALWREEDTRLRRIANVKLQTLRDSASTPCALLYRDIVGLLAPQRSWLRMRVIRNMLYFDSVSNYSRRTRQIRASSAVMSSKFLLPLSST